MDPGATVSLSALDAEFQRALAWLLLGNPRASTGISEAKYLTGLGSSLEWISGASGTVFVLPVGTPTDNDMLGSGGLLVLMSFRPSLGYFSLN